MRGKLPVLSKWQSFEVSKGDRSCNYNRHQAFIWIVSVGRIWQRHFEQGSIDDYFYAKKPIRPTRTCYEQQECQELSLSQSSHRPISSLDKIKKIGDYVNKNTTFSKLDKFPRYTLSKELKYGTIKIYFQ